MGNKLNNKRIFLGTVFAVVLVVCLFLNTFSFKEKVSDLEVSLMANSNQQIANNIELELSANVEFIENLAETLEKKPNMIITDDYLNKKATSIGITDMFLISENKGVYKWTGNGKSFLSTILKTPNLWSNSTMFISEGNNIIFTAPINCSYEKKVIVGVENYDCIENMVEQIDEWNKSIRLIVDKNSEELLVKKIDNNSSIKESEIEKIKELAIANDYSTIINKEGYIIFCEEIQSTGWVHISADKNFMSFEFFTKDIQNFFVLISIETLFFAIVLYLTRKDMKRKEELLMIDSLTGGYNRAGFIKKARDYFKKQQPNGFYIVCINVCDFRVINELWGDDIGNKILDLIYKKIRRNIKKNELVARNSMDHFVVLMEAENEEIINYRVKEIIKKINLIIKSKFMGEKINFTIGACSLVKDNNIPTAISKSQYVGKLFSKFNECMFYDDEIAKKLNEEIEINNLFEKAIENREFVVYLQPKVSKDNRYTAEALVRWVNPERGMIYPNIFIPLLEKNGKISILDKYVFEEVCIIISKWLKETGTAIEISVNLSRFTVKEGLSEIVNYYKEIKEKYEIPDGMIEVELTETVLIDGNHLEYVKKVVNGLREEGFKVSLDDFGFGFSSLSILKELDVDTIKLDRSFFDGESEKSRTIVQGVIQLAHNLKASVVAEGVEELSQVDYLWSCGCDYIQGYIYSKPLPLEKFEKWVDSCCKRGS